MLKVDSWFHSLHGGTQIPRNFGFAINGSNVCSSENKIEVLQLFYSLKRGRESFKHFATLRLITRTRQGHRENPPTWS